MFETLLSGAPIVTHWEDLELEVQADG